MLVGGGYCAWDASVLFLVGDTVGRRWWALSFAVEGCGVVGERDDERLKKRNCTLVYLLLFCF